MNDDHLDAESMRRSRTREETLLALHRVHQAHLAHIEELTGLSGRTIKMALHGQLPYFRRDLALITRRLVIEIVKPRGRAYAITDLGHRRARQVIVNRRREAGRLLARGGARRLHADEERDGAIAGDARPAAPGGPDLPRT
jgi:hypothetical protein